MSGYVKVGDVASLPRPRGVLRVEVEGEPVAIVCSGGGEFHAISDVCSHAEVALSDGEIHGYTVECWLHGSRFDVRTGQPLGPPATRAVPVFDMKVEGDDVYVSTVPSQHRLPSDSSPSQPNQESVR